mgnify:FL=1
MIGNTTYCIPLIQLKTMKKLGLYCAFALVLASCDSAPIPENNAEDLQHDEATRVELIFTPGTLAQDNIKDHIYAQGFTPDASRPTLVLNAETDQATGHRTITPNAGLNFVPNRWYKVEVNLYNHAGTNINRSITAFPHQVNAHQFYFRTLVNNENQADRYADYRYGDVTADGQLVMPPLGFVGYIRFKADLPDGANLNPILVHVVPPAIKTQKRGEPYPFHTPPASLMRDVDVNFPFPISVTP